MRRFSQAGGVIGAGLVVLEIEINMAGGMEFEAGNFAPHPDKGEILLDQALEGAGQFADREFRQIGKGFAHAMPNDTDFRQNRGRF